MTERLKGKIGSCIDCYAWGSLHWYPRCAACYNYNRAHADTRRRCRGCNRKQYCHKDFCRLCWTEAGRRERARPGHGRPLLSILETIDGHQLFFADMLMALRLRYAHASTKPPPDRRTIAPPEPFQPVDGFGQYRLFDASRDLGRFRRPPHSQWLDAAMSEPHIAAALRAADRVAEVHGWSARLTYDVTRGLVIALACRPPDELVRYTELTPLATHRGISIMRVAAVLEHVGLLHDDRPDVNELNWMSRLEGVAPEITQDVLDWLRRLRHGSNRTQPRLPGTANEYCRVVAPILHGWSTSHRHLREITKDDIRDAIATFPARQQQQTLVVLRSLFGFLKKEKRIFANPCARIRPGRIAPLALLPIDTTDYQQAVTAAITPPHRLALVLAAIHAARPSDLCRILLEDIDLATHHITINGNTRPMAALTHRVITEYQYLRYRSATWPCTANRHLFVTTRTALDTRPVSKYTIIQLFKGLNATLGRLRVDRQLEEAITHGPDPLHLAAVFGISHATAMRYSEAARYLLGDSNA